MTDSGFGTELCHCHLPLCPVVSCSSNMAALLIVLLAAGGTGDWQSYTNTNFVSGMVGTDSVLYLATNGGVVKLNGLTSLTSIPRSSSLLCSGPMIHRRKC